MREIKFRGVRSDKMKAEVVYGSLLKLGNGYFIVKPANKEIYEREPSNAMTIEHINDVNPYNPFLSDYFSCALYPVHKDTVSQLVGYDVAGEEVYEGDEVTDKFGHELTARIVSIAEDTNSRGFFRERWGCNFDFKLKKQGD